MVFVSMFVGAAAVVGVDVGGGGGLFALFCWLSG